MPHQFIGRKLTGLGLKLLKKKRPWLISLKLVLLTESSKGCASWRAAGTESEVRPRPDGHSLLSLSEAEDAAVSVVVVTAVLVPQMVSLEVLSLRSLIGGMVVVAFSSTSSTCSLGPRVSEAARWPRRKVPIMVVQLVARIISGRPLTWSLMGGKVEVVLGPLEVVAAAMAVTE